MTKVLLDTDIGDDIDDALALALICCLPELELVGVTTVFGNTLARARQAQTLLGIAGEQFARIPVAAGCPGTLASRKVDSPNADPDHTPGQSATSLPDEKLPPLDPRRGVEFIIDTIMQGDGSVIPITIGALTNLAVALVKEPRLARKIPRLVVMASEVQRPMAEWNIRCDPEAAHIVFSSGIRIDVITYSIGKIAMFTEPETQRLAASNRPLAKYLSATLAAWRRDWKQPAVLPSLFDPMAVAAILKPELFTWESGKITVELRGATTYGYTVFVPGEGLHKVAMSTDREKAVGWYLRQILGE